MSDQYTSLREKKSPRVVGVRVKRPLTLARLVQSFAYDPVTGEFYRLGLSRARSKTSIPAGHVSRLGYTNLYIDGHMYMTHRLAWFYMMGEWPDGEIDHINHVKSDNRWSNLRLVSHAENSKNMPMPRSNTSGTVGVTWNSSKRKWCAKIQAGRKTMWLGSFKDISDAIAARKHAEIADGFHKNHGTRREANHVG